MVEEEVGGFGLGSGSGDRRQRGGEQDGGAGPAQGRPEAKRHGGGAGGIMNCSYIVHTFNP